MVVSAASKRNNVAVCLAGIPDGAPTTLPSIRTHVLEPLDADVFVYAPWARTAEPFDAAVLGRHVINVWREVENISARFRSETPSRWWRAADRLPGSWLGGWVATLGAARRGGSGLCMAYAWHRCLEMIEEYERARGLKYSYVVQSRPDLLWEYDHPLSAQLNARFVWVPEGEDWGGLNDRHAYMSREHADIYFGRAWRDLTSGAAVRLILRTWGRRAWNCTSEGSLFNGKSGPSCLIHEMWLAMRLSAAGLAIRRFAGGGSVYKRVPLLECRTDLARTEEGCLEKIAVAVARVSDGSSVMAAHDADLWRKLKYWCHLHEQEEQTGGGGSRTSPWSCIEVLTDMLLAAEAARHEQSCLELMMKLKHLLCRRSEAT